MLTPEFFGRRVFCAVATALLLSLPASSQPDSSTANSAAVAIYHEVDEDSKKLANGEVLVDTRELGGTRYVAGRILIDETPEKTWRTLANPFEFQGRICQRMKQLEVLTDQAEVSVLRCTMSVVWPIPDLKYTVESKYTPCERVEFHRTAGSLKDFKGFWTLRPVANGSKTEITYSMYIDPGFPVPDWIIRYGISKELPSVLTGLRDRINYLKNNAEAVEKRTLAAATASGASPSEDQPFRPVCLGERK